MKILATGDIHSDLDLIKKINNNVNLNEIDLILLIGDLSEKSNDFYQIL
jgi:Icc-related predicted phosphoesterase